MAGWAGGQSAPGCAPGGVRIQLRSGSRAASSRNSPPPGHPTPVPLKVPQSISPVCAVTRDVCPQLVPKCRKSSVGPGEGCISVGQKTVYRGRALAALGLSSYRRTLEIRSLQIRWEVWDAALPSSLPESAVCLLGVDLCPRGVLGHHCVVLAETQREVGPLSSWLPRRHLTGHGEVWVDQGSPQPFLASVCSELDLRLVEKKTV